jgi:hypothetical protein
MKDHPMFAEVSKNCRMCGSLYDKDDPPDEALKGYCSEDCEFRDRKVDEAEQGREEAV